jgi:hypothetical protein
MYILAPITTTKLDDPDKEYFTLLIVEASKLNLAPAKLYSAITDNSKLEREAHRLGFRRFNELAPKKVHCIEMVAHQVHHEEIEAREWKDGYCLITDGEYEKHFS